MTDPVYNRILLVGRTGSGKTTQIRTLKGRRFAYVFDPNTMASLRGVDMEVQQFQPDILELDATIKGFNKGAKDDKLKGSKREPTLYNRWVEDINEKAEKGFFDDFDWLLFDSLTFLSKAIMARQMYINDRYGGLEDRADYRIVGTKLSDVFSSIAGLQINVLATGHVNVYENEKTHKLETQINLPGSSRNILPLVFTEVLQCTTDTDKDGKTGWFVRTRPDPRGLQDIRTSIPGLDEQVDVTIKDFNNPTNYGLGKILSRYETRS